MILTLCLPPRARGAFNRAVRWGFLVDHRTTPRAAVDAYYGWCEWTRRPAIIVLVSWHTGLARAIVELLPGESFDSDILHVPGMADLRVLRTSDETWFATAWMPPPDAKALAWRLAEWFADRHAEGGAE